MSVKPMDGKNENRWKFEKGKNYYYFFFIIRFI